jgi:hypothetical protein
MIEPPDFAAFGRRQDAAAAAVAGRVHRLWLMASDLWAQ